MILPPVYTGIFLALCSLPYDVLANGVIKPCLIVGQADVDHWKPVTTKQLHASTWRTTFADVVNGLVNDRQIEEEDWMVSGGIKAHPIDVPEVHVTLAASRPGYNMFYLEASRKDPPMKGAWYWKETGSTCSFPNLEFTDVNLIAIQHFDTRVWKE